MDVRTRMLPSHVVLCSHQNLAEDANYQLRLADETQPSPSSNFTSSSTLQRLIPPMTFLDNRDIHFLLSTRIV